MNSILHLLQATHKSSVLIKNLSKENKIKILLRLADLLLENQTEIIQKNKIDLDKMTDSDPKKDRLLLNENIRLEAIPLSPECPEMAIFNPD